MTNPTGSIAAARDSLAAVLPRIMWSNRGSLAPSDAPATGGPPQARQLFGECPPAVASSSLQASDVPAPISARSTPLPSRFRQPLWDNSPHFLQQQQASMLGNASNIPSTMARVEGLSVCDVISVASLVSAATYQAMAVSRADSVSPRPSPTVSLSQAMPTRTSFSATGSAATFSPFTAPVHPSSFAGPSHTGMKYVLFITLSRDLRVQYW